MNFIKFLEINTKPIAVIDNVTETNLENMNQEILGNSKI